MFQTSKKRLSGWLELFDDFLGDPVDPAPPHPHRTPLRWERQRRPGTVPPRQAYCLSPIRSENPHGGPTKDLGHLPGRSLK